MSERGSVLLRVVSLGKVQFVINTRCESRAFFCGKNVYYITRKNEVEIGNNSDNVISEVLRH